MATKTVGTLGTTTLTGLQRAGASSAGLPSEADIASIVNAIINDGDPSMTVPGAWSRMNLLYVPRRGILKVFENDWVAVGPEGFPYLIPAIALGTANTLTGTPVSGSAAMTMTTSALTAGWRLGGQITGTGIPAATLIKNISADGLTITMTANASSSPGATTVTYGSWTHS